MKSEVSEEQCCARIYMHRLAWSWQK